MSWWSRRAYRIPAKASTQRGMLIQNIHLQEVYCPMAPPTGTCAYCQLEISVHTTQTSNTISSHKETVEIYSNIGPQCPGKGRKSEVYRSFSQRCHVANDDGHQRETASAAEPLNYTSRDQPVHGLSGGTENAPKEEDGSRSDHNPFAATRNNEPRQRWPDMWKANSQDI